MNGLHLKARLNALSPPLFPSFSRELGRVGEGLKKKKESFNDPSAGSPTDTLLRLLLPLNDKV